MPTYDTLICAAALEGGAHRLFFEEVQDGLLIDDSLRIVDRYRADTTGKAHSSRGR